MGRVADKCWTMMECRIVIKSVTIPSPKMVLSSSGVHSEGIDRKHGNSLPIYPIRYLPILLSYITKCEKLWKTSIPIESRTSHLPNSDASLNTDIEAEHYNKPKMVSKTQMSQPEASGNFWANPVFRRTPIIRSFGRPDNRRFVGGHNFEQNSTITLEPSQRRDRPVELSG